MLTTSMQAMIRHDDFSAVSIEHLLNAGNWQHQYKLIIQWGKLISAKPQIRTTDNVIRGCEVPVWLMHNVSDEKLYLAVDADSNVIKGLIALLVVQVQGRRVEELKHLDLEKSLRGLGLEKHLTPSRNNGLHGIIKRVHEIIAAA